MKIDTTVQATRPACAGVTRAQVTIGVGSHELRVEQLKDHLVLVPGHRRHRASCSIARSRSLERRLHRHDDAPARRCARRWTISSPICTTRSSARRRRRPRVAARRIVRRRADPELRGRASGARRAARDPEFVRALRIAGAPVARLSPAPRHAVGHDAHRAAAERAADAFAADRARRDPALSRADARRDARRLPVAHAHPARLRHPRPAAVDRRAGPLSRRRSRHAGAVGRTGAPDERADAGGDDAHPRRTRPQLPDRAGHGSRRRSLGPEWMARADR